jgi:hypothetical protein
MDSMIFSCLLVQRFKLDLDDLNQIWLGGLKFGQVTTFHRAIFYAFCNFADHCSIICSIRLETPQGDEIVLRLIRRS